MGAIKVHEFVSLDGVFENPSWTANYGFTDEMGEAIGTRTAADAPGAPFFNDTRST